MAFLGILESSFFFFFFDLAVQVLGWWVTTTTPVTRENVNPVKWDLGEVPQVNIAPLERQSLSPPPPPHLTSSPKEFRGANSIADHKILNLPCR